MKRVVAACLAFGLVLVLGLAGPAVAGSKSWGPKSCAQGTLFTRATGNQTEYHEHRKNGVFYRKHFDNGNQLMMDTFYPLLTVEDAASVQNGTGTLRDTARNCAD